jgi:hypothetical protein
MPTIRRNVAVCLAATAVALAVAHPAHSQTMSFSVYTDAAVQEESLVIYGYVTGSDNSSGCTHNNYAMTANLISPSNRTNPSMSSGFSAQTSLAFDEEEGSYWVTGLGSYSCSCIKYNTAYYGGSASFGVMTSTTYYTGCSGSPLCSCAFLNCTPGTAPHCGIGPVAFTVTFCTNNMAIRWVRTWWSDPDDYVCALGAMYSVTSGGICT